MPQIPDLAQASPGEPLYSILARTYDHFGLVSRRKFLQLCFGSKAAVAVLDLPCHLDIFLSRVRQDYGYTLNQVLYDLTMAPIYWPFISEDKRAKVIADMRSDAGNLVHLRLGIVASTVRTQRDFGLCQICSEEDKSTFGERYWHTLHQAPGVRICPNHKVWLDRFLPPQNRYSRLEFVSAEKIFQPNIPRPIDLSKDIDTRLLAIANDVAWLLDQTKLPSDLETLRQRYINALTDMGLATYSGRIRATSLFERFLEFYSPELLETLDCKLQHGDSDNWLYRLVRGKMSVQSPLQHLLLIQFLEYSAEDFFKTPDKPPALFGQGPWPCLNAACTNYLQPVITQCAVVLRGTRPTGTFQCQCGFTYSRTGPDESSEDALRIGKIIAFGPVWDAKLKEYWHDPDIGLRETARRLAVDPQTVKRRAKLLGFVDDLVNEDEAVPTLTTTKTLDLHCKRDKYQHEWIASRVHNPDFGVTRLREMMPKVYAWLYRNDRDWLRKNSPLKQISNRNNNRVDWNARDTAYEILVINAANTLLQQKDRPIWLTVSSIGREAGILAIIQKHPKKIRLTMKKLSELTESREEFAIRRIDLAAASFRKRGIKPKKWQLIKNAGIARLTHQPTVKNALNKTIDQWR